MAKNRKPKRKYKPKRKNMLKSFEELESERLAKEEERRKRSYLKRTRKE